MVKRKAQSTHSFLIAWDDYDMEKGEFGWTGRATSYEQAEKKARAAMMKCHIENYREKGESIRACCEPYMNDGQFGGRVIDYSKGAAWAAGDLEESLRELLQWGKRHKLTGEPWERAARTIAAIEKGD